MEQLQIQQTNQLANTTINENLVRELFHVNYVINYPLSDKMLEGWAKCLQELEPEITPEIVRLIINKVKIGTIEWDNKKGLQNIFEGFRVYIDYELKKSNCDIKWTELYKKYKKKGYNENSGIL